ncbi:glycoside hydrolase family 27 protein [Silvibacterium dinghuense]|uniref:Alpha-galactosidase n=1 Tax=Silvibacterium dinghuense TaxID=1560006 RepID=A0A4Q1SFT3_9BACT|nr:glycoside hydrolase family 27 protein [Silvibacterium dinghuense]RXS96428.1 glycoside hydrolase family 27 protein [Silvibacterium dinghuense]
MQAEAQTPGSASTGLAATPPMGWNSWNHFAGKVTDADVRAAADALVASGMRDAGYVYVNIDDTWEGERDAQGVIHTNSKFPDMKALADYVHSKGLKLGIYSSPGPKTCAGYEGSYGHEAQDAKSYADWGIDYLKYDKCSFGDVIRKEAGNDHAKAFAMEKAAYKKMHDALAATGRPIVFSLCQYGDNDVWEWGASVGGNLWRTTGDINDSYQRMAEIGFGQLVQARYAGPGHWNDPDMLEIGNGGMTEEEYRQHMTLWVMLAAPLLAGNDLSKMSKETLALLTNKDVIAVDQDAAGIQGVRAWAQGPLEVWRKPLSGGAMAVALFNRSAKPQSITFDLKTVFLDENAKLRNLWTGENVVISGDKYVTTIPGHGAVLLKGTPAKIPEVACSSGPWNEHLGLPCGHAAGSRAQ